MYMYITRTTNRIKTTGTQILEFGPEKRQDKNPIILKYVLPNASQDEMDNQTFDFIGI